MQLSDGHVVAHEALSRGPEGTALECPRLLFQAAAEQGCELELDAACRVSALRRATDAGWAAGADGPLFLNVRPGALAGPGFLAGLDSAVAAVGRGPRDVVLEVSEAERLDASLHRALVSGMDRHRGRRAAVAALARLARDLGMVLVAEGIETPGELRVARDLGVPLGQGFLLGRPSVAMRLGGPAPAFPAGRAFTASSAPRAVLVHAPDRPRHHPPRMRRRA